MKASLGYELSVYYKCCKFAPQRQKVFEKHVLLAACRKKGFEKHVLLAVCHKKGFYVDLIGSRMHHITLAVPFRHILAKCWRFSTTKYRIKVVRKRKSPFS